MGRKSNTKIPTKHESSLSIANPFADIHLEGLPKDASSEQVQPFAGDTLPTTRGRVDVRLEKSGRGGKTVTTLRGFSEDITDEALSTLAFDLKKLCACGGSLKGRTIELQGDLCERVIGELKEMGFRAVRAGG